MTMTPMEATEVLSAQVAAEIRAWMGRLDVRASQLARRVGENDQWLSMRLRGRTPINLNELQRIADALGVEVVKLLPQTMVRPNNRSSAVAVRPMSARRRDVSRPKGRPSAESTRPVSAVPANKRRPQPVGSPNQSMAA